MQGLVITEDEIKIGADAVLINAALERLLFTELGTMLNSLPQGSRILDYLDEGAVEKTAIAVIQEATDLITFNEPRIELEAVGCDIAPDGGTVGIIVYLAWHFVDTTTVETYETLVQKVFVLS